MVFFRNPNVRSFIRTAAWSPVILFFVEHGFSIGSIQGRSMQPTFNPDSNKLRRDIVLLNRWIAVTHEYSRGDVVTLYAPDDPDRVITKRIIALEGDTVLPLPPYPDKFVKIPKGHCWVEGDEIFHSKDSNEYGPVPLALINAKVSYILWPFSRFSKVERFENSRVSVFKGDPLKDHD
ncbi:1798_t:CDS:2 [Funneliformis geosporum]|uniref:Mitochondrial inner membrane protease subunit 2 n=1 Tax=Funneliformis geosporum TaxID=1117311 RepID=A0A9W4SYT8_9GLOM|nr:1798_t:CDS:2 [Funneliformis geosporum]CAI2185633.1 12227_t:CDS:2 [Funneliformis geosporum]